MGKETTKFSKAAEADFLRGEQFFKYGQYDKARECYEKALQKGYTSVRLYCRLASVYALFRQKDKSFDYCEKVRNSQDADYMDNFDLAQAYLRIDCLQEAKESIEKVIAENPQTFSAYNILGDIYSQLGQYDKAESQYKFVINGDSGNLDRLQYDNDEISIYPKIDSLDEEKARAFFGLATLYNQTNRKEEAIKCYKEAIQRNYNSSDVYMGLAVALADRGESNEAKYYLELAYKKGYNRADILDALGHNYHELGYNKDAENCYKELINILNKEKDVFSLLYDGNTKKGIPYDVIYARAVYNLASVYKELNKGQQCIELYKTALKKNPDNIDLLLGLGFEYGNCGNHDELEQCYKEAIKKAPDRASIYCDMGAFYYGNLGQLDVAESYFKKAIEKDICYGLAYHGLAVVYNRRGRYSDALEKLNECKRLIDKKDDNSLIYIIYDIFGCKMGQYYELLRASQKEKADKFKATECKEAFDELKQIQDMHNSCKILGLPLYDILFNKKDFASLEELSEASEEDFVQAIGCKEIAWVNRQNMADFEYVPTVLKSLLKNSSFGDKKDAKYHIVKNFAPALNPLNIIVEKSIKGVLDGYEAFKILKLYEEDDNIQNLIGSKSQELEKTQDEEKQKELDQDIKELNAMHGKCRTVINQYLSQEKESGKTKILTIGDFANEIIDEKQQCKKDFVAYILNYSDFAKGKSKEQIEEELEALCIYVEWYRLIRNDSSHFNEDRPITKEICEEAYNVALFADNSLLERMSNICSSATANVQKAFNERPKSSRALARDRQEEIEKQRAKDKETARLWKSLGDEEIIDGLSTPQF